MAGRAILVFDIAGDIFGLKKESKLSFVTSDICRLGLTEKRSFDGEVFIEEKGSAKGFCCGFCSKGSANGWTCGFSAKGSA